MALCMPRCHTPHPQEQEKAAWDLPPFGISGGSQARGQWSLLPRTEWETCEGRALGPEQRDCWKLSTGVTRGQSVPETSMMVNLWFIPQTLGLSLNQAIRRVPGALVWDTVGSWPGQCWQGLATQRCALRLLRPVPGKSRWQREQACWGLAPADSAYTLPISWVLSALTIS